MILADTSIWIDHLRARDEQMAILLEEEQILIHPFVLGELALGYMPQRQRTLSRLQLLPQSLPARDESVMSLIEHQSLVGTGIGYIDVHLLASALITTGCRFWTRDRRLLKVANTLGIAQRTH